MSDKPSTNLGGLLAVKGDAVSSMPVASPALVAVPQPKKQTGKKPAVPKPPQAQVYSVPVGSQVYWKAMTLRLGREEYMELKQWNLFDSQSSQDSLTEALHDWLEKRRQTQQQPTGATP
jgi:hypothetical protein